MLDFILSVRILLQLTKEKGHRLQGQRRWGGNACPDRYACLL